MELQPHTHHLPAALTKSERLDSTIIRELSQLNPLRSIAHIVFEYVFILSAIVLCSMYWHPAFYIVCVMWIGARQHALGILMHEAAHYRIVKSKRINDFIGEVFLSFPLLISMKNYRTNHLAHHRHMNTDEDPDWVRKDTHEWEFPKSRTDLFWMLIKIVLGMNIVSMLKTIWTVNKGEKKEKSVDRRLLVSKLAYYAVLIATLSYFGWWSEYLLFWIVPMFTWLQVIFRIRSIAEHFGIEYDHVFTQARNTYPSLFDRLFIASKNVWYHLDHHLYPTVPFYNLPQLHEKLNELVPVYRERAHNTNSYLDVLMECTQKK